MCIRDRCLGNEDIFIYLLESEQGLTLLNGGLSCSVPEILGQFKEFGIDEQRINRLIISHAHFDHIGIVPYFKRRLPNLQVYASQRAFEILKNPKAMHNFDKLDRYATEARGMLAACRGYDLAWQGELTGIAVKDGDTIDLGNRRIQIFDLPGHSPCSIAAYVPELQALFPSDGGGIPFQNEITPLGSWNFDAFLASLRKLEHLPVKYLCADHCAYVTGDEAASHISDTLEAGIAFRAEMVELLQRMPDIDQAAKVLHGKYAYRDFGNLMPVESKDQTFKLMLKFVSTAS